MHFFSFYILYSFADQGSQGDVDITGDGALFNGEEETAVPHAFVWEP